MRVPAVAEELLDAIGRRRRLRGERGELVAQPSRAFRSLRGSLGDRLQAIPSRAEQSNSSVTFADRLIFKLYRRLEPGVNSDLEVGRFLTERGFRHVPAVSGSIEYRAPDAEPATTAILQAFVENEGDVWEFTLDALGDYLERAATAVAIPDVAPVSATALLERAKSEIPAAPESAIGTYLDTARLLGTRTGEPHH